MPTPDAPMADPMTDPVPGTQGYAAIAASLVARWERISSAEYYEGVLAPHSADGQPRARCRRRIGARRRVALHGAPTIEWRDDSLPDLATLAGDRASFHLVLLAAVWMHLDAGERRRAMACVAGLLATGGVLIVSLRHGPVPDGRRMFAVSAQETVHLAAAAGLRPLMTQTMASAQPANRSAGVTWTRLAFARE